MSATFKVVALVAGGMVLTMAAGALMPHWVMWGMLVIVALWFLWACSGLIALGIHLLSGWLLDKAYSSGSTLDAYHSRRLRKREARRAQITDEFWRKRAESVTDNADGTEAPAETVEQQDGDSCNAMLPSSPLGAHCKRMSPVNFVGARELVRENLRRLNEARARENMKVTATTPKDKA